jgi:hypothetical protein
MEIASYQIEAQKLPIGFVYPSAFLKILERNLIDLEPWYILSNDLLEWRYSGLIERYPKLSLVPFAARLDNDDIACWETNSPDKVTIIHDFASPGWEFVKNYTDFWHWFRAAIDDMIQFE